MAEKQAMHSVHSYWPELAETCLVLLQRGCQNPVINPGLSTYPDLALIAAWQRLSRMANSVFPLSLTQILGQDPL